MWFREYCSDGAPPLKSFSHYGHERELSGETPASFSCGLSRWLVIGSGGLWEETIDANKFCGWTTLQSLLNGLNPNFPLFAGRI